MFRETIIFISKALLFFFLTFSEVIKGSSGQGINESGEEVKLLPETSF